MKGIFVNSTLNPGQGITDFGYYLDERTLTPAENIEELVDRNEAYAVKIIRALNGDVHVRMSSADREVSAKIEEEVGIRNRGLESTLYQKTGDPVIPSHYEEPDKSNEVLTAISEYTLNHGDGQGIRMENFEWDSLL